MYIECVYVKYVYTYNILHSVNSHLQIYAMAISHSRQYRITQQKAPLFWVWFQNTGCYKLRIYLPIPFTFKKKGCIFPQLKPYLTTCGLIPRNHSEFFLKCWKLATWKGRSDFHGWGQLMGFFPKKIINSNSSPFPTEGGMVIVVPPPPSFLEAKISSPHVWWLRFQAAFLK